MSRILRCTPSPAMVVALLALFVALGGGAYAAISLPRNSVGTKQLKKNAVTGSKIKANAVTSSKVKNGSLLKTDFAAGQLPSGPQGPAGPAGANGATKLTVRDSAGLTVASGTSDFDTVACASGEKATGGGVFVVAGSAVINDVPVTESESTTNSSGDPVGWSGGINNTSAGAVQLVVEAICASP